MSSEPLNQILYLYPKPVIEIENKVSTTPVYSVEKPIEDMRNSSLFVVDISSPSSGQVSMTHDGFGIRKITTIGTSITMSIDIGKFLNAYVFYVDSYSHFASMMHEKLHVEFKLTIEHPKVLKISVSEHIGKISFGINFLIESNEKHYSWDPRVECNANPPDIDVRI